MQHSIASICQVNISSAWTSVTFRRSTKGNNDQKQSESCPLFSPSRYGNNHSRLDGSDFSDGAIHFISCHSFVFMNAREGNFHRVSTWCRERGAFDRRGDAWSPYLSRINTGALQELKMLACRTGTLQFALQAKRQAEAMIAFQQTPPTCLLLGGQH